MNKARKILRSIFIKAAFDLKVRIAKSRILSEINDNAAPDSISLDSVSKKFEELSKEIQG